MLLRQISHVFYSRELWSVTRGGVIEHENRSVGTKACGERSARSVQVWSVHVRTSGLFDANNIIKCFDWFCCTVTLFRETC